MKLLSLMMSRLCHDLLNPIGVVLNSIAMLEEDSVLPEKNSLVHLLKDSNLRSLHLVKCYNLFFGSLLGVQELNNEELYNVLASHLQPVKLKWYVHGTLMRMMPKSLAQIIGQGVLLSENLVLKLHQVSFCIMPTNNAKVFNLDFRFAGIDVNSRQLNIFKHIIDDVDILNDKDTNPSTINMIIFWLFIRHDKKNMSVKIIEDNVVNINFDLLLKEEKHTTT